MSAELKEEKIHPYNEAGRGLLAVIMAHRLGLASIDYTLKKYVPEVVDPSWVELAMELDHGMADSLDRIYAPTKPTDDLPII